MVAIWIWDNCRQENYDVSINDEPRYKHVGKVTENGLIIFIFSLSGCNNVAQITDVNEKPETSFNSDTSVDAKENNIQIDDFGRMYLNVKKIKPNWYCCYID